jgi:hypothetical protein
MENRFEEHDESAGLQHHWNILRGNEQTSSSNGIRIAKNHRDWLCCIRYCLGTRQDRPTGLTALMQHVQNHEDNPPKRKFRCQPQSMSDLISRKFAAINEAIEGHGYRTALQLLAKRDIEKLPLAKVCETRVQNSVVWPILSVHLRGLLQALKAFCLAKMGAEAEALELCDDVMVWGLGLAGTGTGLRCSIVCCYSGTL